LHRAAFMRRILVSLVLAATACQADDPIGDPVGHVEAALATGPQGTSQVTAVAKGATWQLDASGVDRGTGWRAYVAGEWPTGAAPVGYGESYVATTTPPVRTVYLRKQFFVDQHVVRKLYLRAMYDDGFVFYLNGKEGGRASMPAGAIAYATFAIPNAAENRYVTFDISSQIPNLRQGMNTLAVEVHQGSASSSDLVFDAELLLWVEELEPPPAQNGIPRGDLWKLWDLATTPPPGSWQYTAYNDDHWSGAPGPMGYGERFLAAEIGEARPITTYFRRRFELSGSVSKLTAEVLYDDGMVIYVNGHEVRRLAMPAGTVGPGTLSSGHEEDGVYETVDLSAGIPYLVDGLNTIAVEVHQNSASSSDLVFDLALIVDNGWERVSSGTTETLHGVSFRDQTVGWAVGEAGTFLETRDGGATWAPRVSGTTAPLRAIEVVFPAQGYIVGDGGTVLATGDDGETWTARPSGFTADFRDVSFIDGFQGWAVAGSDVYRTKDGALTWTKLPTGTGGTFETILMIDEQIGWLAGMIPVDGDSWAAIYMTTDGGLTWTQQWNAGRHFFYLFDLAQQDESIWAVGQSSLSGVGEHKLVTRDGGVTWEMSPMTSNNSGIYAIAWSSVAKGWGVGFNGSIVRTIDGGTSWQVQQAPSQATHKTLYDVEMTSEQHGVAVGADGAVYVTTTGGE
jgi:photosystem II stability/assembly factor-like uncharacterized protein